MKICPGKINFPPFFEYHNSTPPWHPLIVVMNITFTYFRPIQNQIKVLTSTYNLPIQQCKLQLFAFNFILWWENWGGFFPFWFWVPFLSLLMWNVEILKLFYDRCLWFFCLWQSLRSLSVCVWKLWQSFRIFQLATFNLPANFLPQKTISLVQFYVLVNCMWWKWTNCLLFSYIIRGIFHTLQNFQILKIFHKQSCHPFAKVMIHTEQSCN